MENKIYSALHAGSLTLLIEMLFENMPYSGIVKAVTGAVNIEQRKAAGFIEKLAMGNFREINKYNAAVSDVFNAVLNVFLERKRVKIKDLKKDAPYLESIRREVIKEFKRNIDKYPLGINKTTVSAYEDIELIKGADLYMLSPFIIKPDGTAEFHINTLLLEALYRQDGKKRRELIRSLVERELTLQTYLENGLSFDKAHKKVLDLPGQEELLEFAGGIARQVELQNILDKVPNINGEDVSKIIELWNSRMDFYPKLNITAEAVNFFKELAQKITQMPAGGEKDELFGKLQNLMGRMKGFGYYDWHELYMKAFNRHRRKIPSQSEPVDISKMFENSDIVVFGETHSVLSHRLYLASIMKQLKEAGVTHIFMEGIGRETVNRVRDEDKVTYIKPESTIPGDIIKDAAERAGIEAVPMDMSMQLFYTILNKINSSLARSLGRVFSFPKLLKVIKDLNVRQKLVMKKRNYYWSNFIRVKLNKARKENLDAKAVVLCGAGHLKRDYGKYIEKSGAGSVLGLINNFLNASVFPVEKIPDINELLRKSGFNVKGFKFDVSAAVSEPCIQKRPFVTYNASGKIIVPADILKKAEKYITGKGLTQIAPEAAKTKQEEIKAGKGLAGKISRACTKVLLIIIASAMLTAAVPAKKTENQPIKNVKDSIVSLMPKSITRIFEIGDIKKEIKFVSYDNRQALNNILDIEKLRPIVSDALNNGRQVYVQQAGSKPTFVCIIGTEHDSYRYGDYFAEAVKEIVYSSWIDITDGNYVIDISGEDIKVIEGRTGKRKKRLERKIKNNLEQKTDRHLKQLAEESERKKQAVEKAKKISFFKEKFHAYTPYSAAVSESAKAGKYLFITGRIRQGEAEQLLQTLKEQEPELLKKLGHVFIELKSNNIFIQTETGDREAVKKLHDFVDGFTTIIAISDTHLTKKGGVHEYNERKEDVLISLVREVKKNNSLLVINGDFINLDIDEYGNIRQSYSRLFNELKSLRKIIYIPGNHDPQIDEIKKDFPNMVIDDYYFDAYRGLYFEHGHQNDKLFGKSKVDNSQFYRDLKKLRDGFVGATSLKMDDCRRGLLKLLLMSNPDRYVIKKDDIERMLGLGKMLHWYSAQRGFVNRSITIYTGHSHDGINAGEGHVNEVLSELTGGSVKFANTGVWGMSLDGTQHWDVTEIKYKGGTKKLNNFYGVESYTGFDDEEFSHLPLYLWRPLKARLLAAVNNGEVKEEDRPAVERVLAGKGVARIDKKGKIKIEDAAAGYLVEVINENTARGSPVTVNDVKEYLTFHEKLHKQIKSSPELKKKLKSLLKELKNPEIYRDKRYKVRSFEQLKQYFINNYGKEYSDDEKFIEELAVVYLTEKEKLNQEVRLVADTNNPKERVKLPEKIAGIIEQFQPENFKEQNLSEEYMKEQNRQDIRNLLEYLNGMGAAAYDVLNVFIEKKMVNEDSFKDMQELLREIEEKRESGSLVYPRLLAMLNSPEAEKYLSISLLREIMKLTKTDLENNLVLINSIISSSAYAESEKKSLLSKLPELLEIVTSDRNIINSIKQNKLNFSDFEKLFFGTSSAGPEESLIPNGAFNNTFNIASGFLLKNAEKTVKFLKLRGRPPKKQEKVQTFNMENLDNILDKYEGKLVSRDYVKYGRTLVFDLKDGRKLAVKFGDDPAKLRYEADWMKFLSELKKQAGLESEIPVPEKVNNKSIIKLRAPPRMESENCMIYTVSENYFKYIDDTSLSLKEFSEAMAKNAGDLARLAKHGIFHTDLISLFHNEEQKRIYFWNIESDGAGRLDKWLDVTRYPNIRVSGLADFEHLKYFKELDLYGKPPVPDDRQEPENLQYNIGKTLFKLWLESGRYFRYKGLLNGKNSEAVKETVRESVFNAFWTEFTESGFKPDTDFAAVTGEMVKYMGADRWIYQTNNREAALKNRKPAFFKGLTEERKEEYIHLGPYNGPLPTQNAIKAIYLYTDLACLAASSGMKPDAKPFNITHNSIAALFGAGAAAAALMEMVLKALSGDVSSAAFGLGIAGIMSGIFYGAEYFADLFRAKRFSSKIKDKKYSGLPASDELMKSDKFKYYQRVIKEIDNGAEVMLFNEAELEENLGKNILASTEGRTVRLNPWLVAETRDSELAELQKQIAPIIAKHEALRVKFAGSRLLNNSFFQNIWLYIIKPFVRNLPETDLWVLDNADRTDEYGLKYKYLPGDDFNYQILDKNNNIIGKIRLEENKKTLIFKNINIREEYRNKKLSIDIAESLIKRAVRQNKTRVRAFKVVNARIRLLIQTLLNRGLIADPVIINKNGRKIKFGKFLKTKADKDLYFYEPYDGAADIVIDSAGVLKEPMKEDSYGFRYKPAEGGHYNYVVLDSKNRQIAKINIDKTGKVFKRNYIFVEKRFREKGYATGITKSLIDRAASEGMTKFKFENIMNPNILKIIMKLEKENYITDSIAGRGNFHEVITLKDFIETKAPDLLPAMGIDVIGSIVHADKTQINYDEEKLFITQNGETREAEYISKGDFGFVFQHPFNPDLIIKLAKKDIGRTINNNILTEFEMMNQLAAEGLSPKPVELGDEGKYFYIIAEKVKGVTLTDILSGKRGTYLPKEKVLELVRRLINDLRTKGFQVSDIWNMNNIMIGSSGSSEVKAYLVDAGCAEKKNFVSKGFYLRQFNDGDMRGLWRKFVRNSKIRSMLVGDEQITREILCPKEPEKTKAAESIIKDDTDRIINSRGYLALLNAEKENKESVAAAVSKLFKRVSVIHAGDKIYLFFPSRYYRETEAAWVMNNMKETLENETGMGTDFSVSRAGWMEAVTENKGVLKSLGVDKIEAVDEATYIELNETAGEKILKINKGLHRKLQKALNMYPENRKDIIKLFRIIVSRAELNSRLNEIPEEERTIKSKELAEGFVKELEPYFNSPEEAFAWIIWFDEIFPGKINFTAFSMKKYLSMIMKLNYGTPVSYSREISAEVLRINGMLGEKLYEKSPAAGVTDPEEKRIMKEAGGAGALAELLFKLNIAVIGTAIELSGKINPAASEKGRWDGLLAAAVGESRNVSFVYIMEQLRGFFRRKGESLVPNLNSVISVLTAT